MHVGMLQVWRSREGGGEFNFIKVKNEKIGRNMEIYLLITNMSILNQFEASMA